MDNITVDTLLRPTDWNDYIGQEKVKKNLRIIIDAAKKRGESADHLLFHGQAGLGKTTLAHLVAHDLQANLKITTGPALEKMGDLAAVLSNLEDRDVLFIDEIHRLNKSIEEVLYPAMESRKLHIIVGKGPGARTVSLDLPPFTIIAATTKPHLVSGPLRSRFGASFKLDFYELTDIERIIARSAETLSLSIDPEAIHELALASRATPRVANRLLKRVRDYAEVHNHSIINKEVVRKTLEVLDIDSIGLEPMDRRLIELIISNFNGGPVGVNSLAAALNDDVGNIEDVYEPFLISLGFLIRTPSGRIATDAAYHHLGLPEKENRFIK
ncbi:MAG: Holliday junction branch migration DNA helicase RuvB [Candidatus Harrisonbacteria bacterium]|nr:Holliday junction branch migration DNA helicase RuvB [Candidatus Harrisonbacteria bacterium]